jgi:condensation domain-containing protein
MLPLLPSDLSNSQASIWLDQQLFAGKPIHNTGQVLAIRGKLRVDLFERALRETIAESPGLRLPPRSGLAPFNLSVLDFRKENDSRAAAEEWMRAEMHRPISLDESSLFFFALIRIGGDHTLWFQKYHHIIIDATGRRLLSERTARRYGFITARTYTNILLILGNIDTDNGGVHLILGRDRSASNPPLVTHSEQLSRMSCARAARRPALIRSRIMQGRRLVESRPALPYTFCAEDTDLQYRRRMFQVSRRLR